MLETDRAAADFVLWAKDARLGTLRRCGAKTSQSPMRRYWAMGSFSREDWQRADFQLMLSSPVQMFWNPGLLENSLTWLRNEGYRLIEIDSAAWRSTADMHVAFEDRLSLPPYYGRNLDALGECMTDFGLQEFGSDSEATGTVLVLMHYDAFMRAEPKTGHLVLDIFASASRTAMLIGHRFLCLVQTDDPRLVIKPVGSQPVIWNQREFLDSSRGL